MRARSNPGAPHRGAYRPLRGATCYAGFAPRTPQVSAPRPQDAEEALQRVVEAVGHPLLERDDRIVRDRDALRAGARAALGDVAVADAVRGLQVRQPVLDVERVHLQGRRLHQVAGADEAFVQLVVPQDVADVLAEEALDALAELLHAVHVRLRHAPGAVGGVGRPRLERLDALLHAVVPGD